jgi:hypothetical protein
VGVQHDQKYWAMAASGWGVWKKGTQWEAVLNSLACVLGSLSSLEVNVNPQLVDCSLVPSSNLSATLGVRPFSGLSYVGFKVWKYFYQKKKTVGKYLIY